tara:strand:+ start:100 stop:435 length:336 start_codon:yes stop_codon:yes gene_type:complete
LKNDELIKHKVRADPDDEDAIFEVWIKEISFLDIQNAAQRMFVVKDGDVSMSLSGYWEFAFSNWIVKTNPSLSKEELLSLKGYVGEQISKVLPQPNDLAEVLQGGFTKQGS